MRSAGSPGSPDPESKSKPRAGSLTLASPPPQLADGPSPSTAAGLVPLLVEMVKQTDIFSVAAAMLEKERGFIPVWETFSGFDCRYSRMNVFISPPFIGNF